MFSNRFNISYDNEEKLFDIFQEKSMTFAPRVIRATDNIIHLIDEYSKTFKSIEYKDVCVVYQYSIFGKPLYIGMSHNGHTNRFNRQLKGIFIDKFKNMKSPSKGYNRKNSRERFIFDIHEKNINVDGISLQVLSLEQENLGNYYNFVKGIIDNYGVSMYEQVLMNTYFRKGIDDHLLNKGLPANTSSALMSVKTRSNIVHDIREEKISVYDFIEG